MSIFLPDEAFPSVTHFREEFYSHQSYLLFSVFITEFLENRLYVIFLSLLEEVYKIKKAILIRSEERRVGKECRL